MATFDNWSVPRHCSCGLPATIYALGKHAGDIGVYCCASHIPTGFIIEDKLKGN